MKSFVLVIEDHPLHAKLFTEALRAAGILAVAAMSGTEGLAIAASNKPELIIVDIFLPDRPGHEVIFDLRQCPENGTVPIIAITASPERTVEALSIAAGANVFLSKPVRLSRLKKEVIELLRINL